MIRPHGKIPRVNLSVKLSSLCARFDPLDPNTETIVRERLRELFREAARLQAAVTVDMEQYAFRESDLGDFSRRVGRRRVSRAALCGDRAASLFAGLRE